MSEEQTMYLEGYLSSLSLLERQKYTSFSAGSFCADRKNANICSDLVRSNAKTATCSMKYWYESGKEPMPAVGHLQVVTDWEGIPTSIIETEEVKESEFCNVSSEFAKAEGEGDTRLAAPVCHGVPTDATRAQTLASLNARSVRLMLIDVEHIGFVATYEGFVVAIAIEVDDLHCASLAKLFCQYVGRELTRGCLLEPEYPWVAVTRDHHIDITVTVDVAGAKDTGCCLVIEHVSFS